MQGDMPNCLVIAFDGHITTDKSRQTTCDGIRVMEGEADYYITKLRGSWVSPVHGYQQKCKASEDSNSWLMSTI